ncbi:MAG: flagellar basal body protein [Alphaproteobacteria bacterium]
MDITKLSVFKALSAKMTWLNERQRLVAANVANADTPGYQARDLKQPDFDRMLRSMERNRTAPSAGAMAMARTDGKHITGGGGSGALTGAEVMLDPTKTDGLEASPTGNAVVLEEEMMKVAKTAADYELMANLYQRNLGMLRLAIGKSGGR